MARISVQSDELRQRAGSVEAADVNDIPALQTGQIQALASDWQTAAYQARWQEWQSDATQVQHATDSKGSPSRTPRAPTKRPTTRPVPQPAAEQESR